MPENWSNIIKRRAKKPFKTDKVRKLYVPTRHSTAHFDDVTLTDDALRMSLLAYFRRHYGVPSEEKSMSF